MVYINIWYIYMVCIYIYDIHIYIIQYIYIYIVQMERGSIIPRIYILGLHICYFTYCINSQFLFLARAPRSFHGSKKSKIWNLPTYNIWLVVYLYPSEEYEFVSWDYSSQYMEY